jgi:hypothetical protein
MIDKERFLFMQVTLEIDPLDGQQFKVTGTTRGLHMFANELRKLVNAIQVRSATSLASYAARA